MGNFDLAMNFIAEEERRDVPMCHHPGCQSSAIKCSIPSMPDWDHQGRDFPEKEEYYCPKHAPEYGYCSCCGAFIAGTEDDGENICDLCRDEIEIYPEHDDYDWNEDFEV